MQQWDLQHHWQDAAGEKEITFTFAEHIANIEQQAPQVYAVVQEYMKRHPNIKIELSGAGADDHTRNIQMAAQSNTLADMREAGVFSDNAKNTDYALSVEQFLTGKAAMLNSGVWDTKKFDQSDISENVYYWWGPTFEDGVGNQQVSMKAPAHPYVVSSKVKAEEPEKYAAIIDFLKFYYGEEGTEIIAKDNQSIPVTQYKGEIDREAYPVFGRVIDAMNDDWSSPSVCPDMYVSGQIINQYRESICGVINGIYTPQEAVDYLDEVQATIQ